MTLEAGFSVTYSWLRVEQKSDCVVPYLFSNHTHLNYILFYKFDKIWFHSFNFL